MRSSIVLLLLTMLAASLPAAAAENVASGVANPLSVHVLSLQTGLPAAGIEVKLQREDGDHWIELTRKRTDDNGRIGALYPDGVSLRTGVYRIVFETGDWFAARHETSFFPEIPVVVRLDATLKHYHVPILLSPYGYSVYRGS